MKLDCSVPVRTSWASRIRAHLNALPLGKALTSREVCAAVGAPPNFFRRVSPRISIPEHVIQIPNVQQLYLASEKTVKQYKKENGDG